MCAFTPEARATEGFDIRSAFRRTWVFMSFIIFLYLIKIKLKYWFHQFLKIKKDHADQQSHAISETYWNTNLFLLAWFDEIMLCAYFFLWFVCTVRWHLSPYLGLKMLLLTLFGTPDYPGAPVQVVRRRWENLAGS